MSQKSRTSGDVALASLGFKLGGVGEAASSPLQFDDNRRFRVEIPSVEGPAAFSAVLEAADEFGVKVDRISQGSGVMMLLDAEIREMLELGKAHDVEVCLFLGPRGSWDIGGQATSSSGHAVASALRGHEQLSAAIEEVVHGAELGLRCVLVADAGLLWTLGRLRSAGDLPPDLKFKMSASYPISNPATAAMLEGMGADSLNISVDLTVSQMAGIRSAVSIPLDVYVEAPDDFGSPVRFHEVAEMVRVASPIYLKFAVRNSPSLYPAGRHLRSILLDTAKERVRRAALALQVLERYSAAKDAVPFYAGYDSNIRASVLENEQSMNVRGR